MQRSFVMAWVVALGVAGAAGAASALADPAAPAVSPAERPRRWHAGLDLRTDLGTHTVRAIAGVRWCVWDVSAVVDPLAIADGEHDADLLVERSVAADRFAVLAGWRTTTIGIAGGLHFQQRSLLGLTAALPDLAGGRLRSRWSLELATLWVKHGDGAATEWLALDRGLLDHLSLGMFVRFEYESGR